MEKIIIDDGTREFSIENKKGEVLGHLVFRPGDIGILQRFQEKYREFQNMQGIISEIDLNSDGTAEETDDIENGLQVLEKVQNLLKDTMNYIFDADVYDSFFSKTNPFSSINGKFFVDVVMEAVGNIIGGSQKQRKQKVKEQVAAHTKGYTK